MDYQEVGVAFTRFGLLIEKRRVDLMLINKCITLFAAGKASSLSQSDPMRNAARLVVVLVAVLGLAACVLIPIPQDRTDGRSISPESESAITVGSSTRQDVIGLLGEPNLIWEEEKIIVYAWDYTSFGVWGGFYGGPAGYGEFTDHNFLFVQFDDDGLVILLERIERDDEISVREMLIYWAGVGDDATS